MHTRWQWQVAAMAALAAFAAPSHAQDSTAARTVTAEAAVGTGVADKALVGAAESFPRGTPIVWCFSRVTGLTDGEVEHVWYKGDAETSRVKLSIMGSPFRTWSSKRLPADAAGEWRCDVVHAGKVIQSVRFRVE